MDKMFALMLGMLVSYIILAALIAIIGPNVKQIATQICQFLDTDLIDYEMDGTKFEYIKCGDKKLIEGLNAEKLIEVIG